MESLEGVRIGSGMAPRDGGPPGGGAREVGHGADSNAIRRQIIPRLTWGDRLHSRRSTYFGVRLGVYAFIAAILWYVGPVSFRELFATDGLSLDRLHALVAVADAGSIAAAAPDNKNRQTLLSRQVGELEKFFDVTLKRVEGRTARLTEDGRQLAGLAREHLQSLDEFKREVSARPLTVSLATGASLHAWLVLPRLARLRAETGRMVWQLHTRRNAALYQQLVDGSLDFALLRSDLARKPTNSESRAPSIAARCSGVWRSAR